jgi:hypothetical protein
MMKAKVVIADKASGDQLADPVTTISSPVTSGALRISLPDSLRPGIYFLRALNAYGEDVAQSTRFQIE